jgi:hypothetical protein
MKRWFHKSYTNVNRNVLASPTANKSRSSNQRTALKLPVVTPYGILPSFQIRAVSSVEKKLKFHCVDFKLARADRRQSLWCIRDIKYTYPG